MKYLGAILTATILGSTPASWAADPASKGSSAKTIQKKSVSENAAKTTAIPKRKIANRKMANDDHRNEQKILEILRRRHPRNVCKEIRSVGDGAEVALLKISAEALGVQRFGAIVALGCLQRASVRQALEKRLADDALSPLERRLTLRAYAMAGPPAGVSQDLLAEELRHKDAGVRLEAAWALRRATWREAGASATRGKTALDAFDKSEKLRTIQQFSKTLPELLSQGNLLKIRRDKRIRHSY